MEESDEDLVVYCQQGSHPAFATLVTRYQPRLLRFLEKQLGNRQDAEDVTQRTFLQAHGSLGRFKSGFRFAPWIFTIARRQGIDFLRQAGSRRKLQERLRAEPAPETDADPSQLLGQLEGVDELWRQIWHRLDSRSCEILWLRVQEEMELSEIAEVMKLTRSHVKVILHRARKSLLKTFGDTPSDSSTNPTSPSPQSISTPLSR